LVLNKIREQKKLNGKYKDLNKEKQNNYGYEIERKTIGN
jgi:hypothetical protein